MKFTNDSKINSEAQVGQLRGLMFEVVVRKWLVNSNFTTIMFNRRNIYLREDRQNFLELRGRGTWHQIDIPCDYDYTIPFVNPIRLLGEVKFYKDKIGKEKMREFVGVIKDISENYVVPVEIDRLLQSTGCSVDCQECSLIHKYLLEKHCPYHSIISRKDRYTEIGAFFSATGFDQEAINLAFAHNIQTVSYDNNPVVKKIAIAIDNIAKNDLSYDNCLSQGNRVEFVEQFNSLLLEESNYHRFVEKFKPNDGFGANLDNLRRAISAVKSDFLATTSAGTLLHFISDSEFPDYLFDDKDNANTTVYYEKNRNENDGLFYMQINDDHRHGKFYFSPPLSLKEAVYKSNSDPLNEKSKYFRKITIVRVIKNIRRFLVLELDKDWLEAAKESGIEL